MKPYKAKPIDTSCITLSLEIEALTEQLAEQLAENAHDLWAKQRLADDWRYGPSRDDAQKHHPCLIPYADFPTAEKVYDRQAAMETLKAIVALGYGIEKNQ